MKKALRIVALAAAALAVAGCSQEEKAPEINLMIAPVDRIYVSKVDVSTCDQARAAGYTSIMQIPMNVNGKKWREMMSPTGVRGFCIETSP